jgi:hypothetical protein
VGMGPVTRVVLLVKGLCLLPVEWTRYYLSLFLSWMLYIASVVGVRPVGYMKASKVHELNRIIEHLYAQGDLYRKAIRELKEDLDAKDTDRRRALKKLKHTKEEIAVLSESLSMLRRQYEKDSTEHEQLVFDAKKKEAKEGGGHDQYRTVVHVSFGLLALVFWLFSRTDTGVLEWKIVMSVFFPIIWMYFSQVVFGGYGHGMRSVHIVLLSSMWGMIGFIAALLILDASK